MQHILQKGLQSGMSAVSGLHSSKPHHPPADFDGLKAVLPADFVPTGKSRVTFKGAKGDVHASYISIGAWSWGDKATWQWSPDELPGLKEAWKYLLSQGINFIDTAQAYGSGESERICGDLVEGMNRSDFVIQTKLWVVPDKDNIVHPVESPVKKLRESLERMRLDFVDIYMVHGHIHPQSIKQVAKGMAECVEQGLAKAIAVANYSEEDMIQFAEELSKYGVPLAANQVEFSILRRYPEVHGLLQACKDRGIVFQSYSSVAQGRLTGKYTSDNPPPKTHRFSSYDMKHIEPTLAVLERIAKAHDSSIPGVALNYNLSKGVIPVVGVRNLHQAEGNVKALGWRLSNEEIKEIDGVSFEGKSTVLWQQG